jgi:hypothetical protein
MAGASKKAVPHESFEEAVAAVQASTRFSHFELAVRLGVSGKSLRRYMNGTRPPASRGRDMVQRLTGIDPALQQRVAASLGVSTGPENAADLRHAKAVLDAAILQACEQYGLLPQSVRAIARILLDAVQQSGLDPSKAREFVAPSGART